jgi:hypothetical protein
LACTSSVTWQAPQAPLPRAPPLARARIPLPVVRRRTGRVALAPETGRGGLREDGSALARAGAGRRVPRIASRVHACVRSCACVRVSAHVHARANGVDDRARGVALSLHIRHCVFCIVARGVWHYIMANFIVCSMMHEWPLLPRHAGGVRVTAWHPARHHNCKYVY